jgi:hypothetical protein
MTKPDPAYAPPNVVTLLTAKGKRLTKKITKAGEKKPAETPTLFTHAAEPVEDLEDLFGLLRWLDDKTHTVTVRPAVIEGAPVKIRRISSGPEQGLIDVPRSWLMIDVDLPVIQFPRGWRRNPERHIRRLIRAALPPAFHRAGVIVQFSSGMRADGGTPRVHLWFWLNAPLISIAAKRWLKDCPLDDTIYNKGQPHFTAAPIFESGVDPLGDSRLVLLPGPVVEVPDDLDTSAPEEADIDMSVDLSGLVNLDLRNNRWRREVRTITGDLATGKGFHDGIRSAAMAYISCHYDPQVADPVADLDYAEFERTILEHVSTLTDLSPERQADLDERLRDMRRCFWGALPKVQAEIIKRSIPFIDVPRGPSMTLLEMYDRGKAARDAAR